MTKRQDKGNRLAATGNAAPTVASGPAAQATRISEGQRLLRARSESFGELAEMLGANKGSVHRWASGEKAPGPAARATLEEKLGIPRLAWSQEAHTSDPSAEAQDARRAAVDQVREATREAASATTLEELRRVLAKIQEIDVDGMLPTEQARVFDSETKVLALIYKIEQDERKAAAELEDALCDHPSFRRMTKALVAALRPFGPDALNAAVQALEGATGGQAA